MESGVKDAHLGNVREDTSDGINALQISGVVERSQIGKRGKFIQHFFVEKDGPAETLAAMHHAVADSIQLAERLQYTILFAREHVENELHTGGMLRNLLLQRHLLTRRQLQLEE